VESKEGSHIGYTTIGTYVNEHIRKWQNDSFRSTLTRPITRARIFMLKVIANKVFSTNYQIILGFFNNIIVTKLFNPYHKLLN
jgi:hypothetical protein